MEVQYFFLPCVFLDLMNSISLENMYGHALLKAQMEVKYAGLSV